MVQVPERRDRESGGQLQAVQLGQERPSRFDEVRREVGRTILGSAICGGRRISWLGLGSARLEVRGRQHLQGIGARGGSLGRGSDLANHFEA